MVKPSARPPKPVPKFNPTPEVPVKKTIQKAPSELRRLYSALVLSISREKNKALKERMNPAIDAFLSYLKSNSEEIPKSMIGSRGIQNCLKYGLPAHKQLVLLVIMKMNVVKLIGSKYGLFIFQKIFKFCRSVPQFGVLQNFFEENIQAILKAKDGALAISAYVGSLPPGAQNHYLFRTLPSLRSSLPEFFIQEFIQEKLEEKKYLISPVTHALLLDHFDKLGEKKGDLLANLLNFAPTMLRKKTTLQPLLALLAKLYISLPWESQKELLKGVFKERFLEFYRREPAVIGVLFMLLSRVSNVKVFDMTILPVLTGHFTEIAGDHLLVKVFIYLLTEIRFFSQDAAFAGGKELFAHLNLPKVFQTENFERNRAHLAAGVFSGERVAEVLKLDFITQKSLENSTFSIFFGSLVQHLLSQETDSELVEPFLVQFFDQLKAETSSLDGPGVDKRFMLSPIGHRLAKRVIQCLKGASEQNRVLLEKEIARFLKTAQKDLKGLVKTKGVFLLIAIVENSEHGEQLKIALKQSKVFDGAEKLPGLEILKDLAKN